MVAARKRRTQAERRATTRTAVLDAAIDCLAARGYARTTTRLIAEQAGVTPGALQHHFATKAELLGETSRHISARMAQEMLAQGPPAAGPILTRHGELLDRMWQLYKGPLFEASLELLVAARTDAELRAQMVETQQEITRLIAQGAPILYPELAGRPGLEELLATGQAAMRGLILHTYGGGPEPDELWPPARAILLKGIAQFIDEAKPSPGAQPHSAAGEPRQTRRSARSDKPSALP